MLDGKWCCVRVCGGDGVLYVIVKVYQALDVGNLKESLKVFFFYQWGKFYTRGRRVMVITVSSCL